MTDALVRALPYLGYDDDGVLTVAGRSALDLLAEFGSPLVAYLPERVTDNLDSVRSAFGARFPDVRVHYALKACYLEPCVRAAREAGVGIEVMSGLELQIATAQGFHGAQIICNGLGRDDAYVRAEAALDGALHIADTEADLLRLAETAGELGTTLRTGLRITPEVEQLPDLMPLDSKLGNTWPDGQFLRMLDLATGLAGIEVHALQVHGFTHAASPAEWGLLLRGMVDVAVALWEQRAVRFPVIDIGGGFEIRSVLEARGLGIDDFAAVAHRELERIPYPYTLVVEPGRYAVADAAVGLARVVARKQREGFRWDLVDLATNTLIPVPGAQYAPVPVRRDDAPVTTAMIGDGTCAPSVMHGPAPLPEQPVGSAVAMLFCGAYTSVFAHVWGPLSPTTIAVDAAGQTESLISPDDLSRAVRSIYGYDLDLWSGRQIRSGALSDGGRG